MTYGFNTRLAFYIPLLLYLYYAENQAKLEMMGTGLLLPSKDIKGQRIKKTKNFLDLEVRTQERGKPGNRLMQV